MSLSWRRETNPSSSHIIEQSINIGKKNVQKREKHTHTVIHRSTTAWRSGVRATKMSWEAWKTNPLEAESGVLISARNMHFSRCSPDSSAFRRRFQFHEAAIFLTLVQGLVAYYISLLWCYVHNVMIDLHLIRFRTYEPDCWPTFYLWCGWIP